MDVRDGQKVETDVFDRVLENWKKVGLDALVSIGGDGSMRISQRAIERGLTNIVGVPKTNRQRPDGYGLHFRLQYCGRHGDGLY